MTISSEVNRSGPYIGNGVTTVFDYDFKIVSENHIKVIKRDTTGVETILTIDADYIVSDVGNSSGGQVALTSALPAGETVTLLLNVPFLQQTDLENQGAYYAETMEAGFDLATQRDLQLKEEVDRSVKIPASADASALDGLIADIVRLGASADNIDTVANISDDVVTVAGISDQVTTVANRDADIGTVAARDADIGVVAGIADKVTEAADNMAAIVDAPNQAQAAENAAAAAAQSAVEAANNAASVDPATIVHKADTDASLFEFVAGKDDTPADPSKVVPDAERADTYAPIFNPAIRRDLAEKLGRIPDLYDFHTTAAEGSSANWGTDQADCKAAFQDAMDWVAGLTTGNVVRTVHLPAGIYRYTETPIFGGAKAQRGLCLRGAGIHSTVLLADGAIDALDVTLPANSWWFRRSGGVDANFGVFELADLSLLTNNSDTANLKKGLSLNGGSMGGRGKAQTLIRNVTAGPWNAGAQQFGEPFSLLDSSKTIFQNVDVEQGAPGNDDYGIAFAIRASAEGTDPTSYFFDNVSVTRGLQSLLVDGQTIEGIQLVNADFVASAKGIVSTTGFGPQLVMVGGHINTTQECIDVTNLLSMNILGVAFLTSGSTAVIKGSVLDRSVINGSIFRGVPDGTNSIAVDLDGANANGWTTLSGNTFKSFDVGVNVGSSATKIKIDGSNSFDDVTEPWRIATGAKSIVTPGYGATVSTSVAIGLTTATPAVLSFNSEIRNDCGDFHSTSANSGRLTVPAGVRRARLTANVQFLAGGTGDRQIWIRKNGTTDVARASQPAASSTNSTYLNVSTPVLDVVAGDYFELLARQDSGGALSVINGANTFFALEVIDG